MSKVKFMKPICLVSRMPRLEVLLTIFQMEETPPKPKDPNRSTDDEGSENETSKDEGLGTEGSEDRSPEDKDSEVGNQQESQPEAPGKHTGAISVTSSKGKAEDHSETHQESSRGKWLLRIHEK